MGTKTIRQRLQTGDCWPARTALVIAHPGHELRIWRWLELTRPIVLVVTDGSGRSTVPRIGSTEKLVRECGAAPGRCFGVMRDLDLYADVLQGNTDVFRWLVDFMTREFVNGRVECIVGDAAEGQVMAHDLIREVRRVAVRQAEQELGWSISHFEFALDSPPDVCPVAVAELARRIRLDDAALARKIAVARRYGEVSDFVQLALEQLGESAFAVECLFPCTDESLISHDPEARLAYEIHGEQQVKLGNYPQVIRYAEHILPIVNSFSCAAERVAG